VAADGVLDVAAIAGSEVDVSRAIGRVMVAVGTETGTEPEAEPVMKTGGFDAIETTASVGGAGALIPQ